MKKPAKAQQQQLAVAAAVLSAGFVADGTTSIEAVRIPTQRSPVYGGTGGELRTLGGRARYIKPGSDVRVTVGPRTTNIYRVIGGKTKFLANLYTRDIVPADLIAKLTTWSAEEICGAPGCDMPSGHETYCEKHREGAELRHAYELARYPYPEDHT